MNTKKDTLAHTPHLTKLFNANEARRALGIEVKYDLCLGQTQDCECEKCQWDEDDTRKKRN